MAGLEINLKIIRDNRCLCGQTTVQSVFKQKKKKKKKYFFREKLDDGMAINAARLRKDFLSLHKLAPCFMRSGCLMTNDLNYLRIFILFLCYSPV